MPATRITLVNAVLALAWRRGVATRPSLEPDNLVARAQALAGSDDAGADDGWYERLAVLTRDLEQEAALTALGRTIAHGQLVAALANRLRAAALLRAHPEIAAHPFRQPVIIIGQMRSGSTRMQRLLSCDPQFAYTRFFESWNPVRRWALRGLDDRRWRSRAGLAAAGLLNPRFESVHPTRLDDPDEEIGLLSLAIFGTAFEAQWRVPNFARQCEDADARPVYATFANMMQLLAWQRGELRPWIMKIPQFAQDLAVVRATFPDARFIFLHRAEPEIAASSVALARNQFALQSDDVDDRWLAAEWARKIALRDRRVAVARAGLDNAHVDVGFEAMNADWEGEIKRVYAELDLNLSTTTLTAMRAYANAARQAKLVRHREANAALTPAQT